MGTVNTNLRLYSIFEKSEYLSVKLSSYFQTYEDIFSKYVGKPITFVEVGVLHGGSLFMWRDYFGPQARIIGVELNPDARKWEQHGFEIFIGDQGDPDFWAGFFAKVGKVDVFLDDGGHSNIQQVVTTSSAMNHINDGGVILVEDVGASYMARFGNPSRYSFINFAKRIIDVINSRCSSIPEIRDPARRHVYSVAFYESMVAFHIDSRKSIVSQVVTNSGKETGAQDMRVLSEASYVETLTRQRMDFLKRLSFAQPAAAIVFQALRSLKSHLGRSRDKRALKEYFEERDPR
jgi:hypothetical protein